MGKLVKPKVFLVGATCGSLQGIKEYLKYTGQQEFEEAIKEATEDEKLSPAEILCSMFAKLCYKSLVVGKNANVKKTRSIKRNLEATYDSAHGSVFEHVSLNFIATDVSRVFTHELVRHRAGTAFSQTSGRYCRLDNIDLVWDPVLDPVKDLFLQHVEDTERVVYLAECRLGLRKPNPKFRGALDHYCLSVSDESWKTSDTAWVPDDAFDFDKRKKITSAIRRIAPNGQSNEIAFSVNIRSLRHMVQMRTAPGAEYEIRDVFAQVYHLVAANFPTIFHGAKTKIVDELLHVYGMRLQPYEIQAGDPAALVHYSSYQLEAEVYNRKKEKTDGNTDPAGPG